jgi:hypothetical protein
MLKRHGHFHRSSEGRESRASLPSGTLRDNAESLASVQPAAACCFAAATFPGFFLDFSRSLW